MNEKILPLQGKHTIDVLRGVRTGLIFLRINAADTGEEIVTVSLNGPEAYDLISNIAKGMPEARVTIEGEKVIGDA